MNSDFHCTLQNSLGSADLSKKLHLRPWIHTTTEQAFVPGHLSRLPLGPEQKVAFVPGPTASQASGEDRGLLSRVEAPTGTKEGPFEGPFVPVGGSTRDKRPNPFIPVGNTNPD